MNGQDTASIGWTATSGRMSGPATDPKAVLRVPGLSWAYRGTVGGALARWTAIRQQAQG